MTWLFAALCLAAEPESDAGAWRFVAPPPADAFEHPPLRAIGLAREKPEDVVEKVTYRGTRQRYAQIRFGSPSSVRVSVVLDELGPGAADLYVDTDRNRRIEEGDRVAGENRTWRIPLKVAIVEAEITRYEPRAAIFRLGATGLTFSYAAAGYLEGSVMLGEHKHAARRMDGDGNGLLTDAQDRLWIDLNDDGQWDAANEQFLFASILPIGSGRFALRSDPFGHRLTLAPLEGSGKVRLAIKRPTGAARVADVAATLIGSDGSAFGLTSMTTEAVVPIGEYRLGTLTLTLADPQGGEPWNFVFSDIGRRGQPKWYTLENGGTLEIDPVGQPLMDVSVEEQGPRRPGEALRVQPQLFTGDGLLIVTCYRGAVANPATESGGAEITLATTGGRTFERARSGFA